MWWGLTESPQLSPRSLRPDKQEDTHTAVALRAYIHGLELLPQRAEFYLYNEILPGYAWIFPLGDSRANIGLGMRLDKFRREKLNLKQMLAVFMDMPEIKKRLQPGWELKDVATWQLGFGSQKNIRRVYDGALLVGDAAELINPLTGGGIHNALISAELAASSIHEALVMGDVSREKLMEYETAVHDKLWSGMRSAYLLQRMLQWTPWAVDWLIRFAGSSSGLTQTFMEKF